MFKKKRLESRPGTSVTAWLYNNIEIAQVKTYKDYVKRKETDRIRTKYTTVSDIRFNKENLKELFPEKIDAIYEITDIFKLERKEGSQEDWIKNRLKGVLPNLINMKEFT